MFDHPREVCMTYVEHFKFSMSLSFKFTEAAFKAFVHAILPCYYIKSSTEINEHILYKLQNSGCNSDKNE